ncbi:MAG: hypothetical protein IJ125_04660 [Atopobiaceae bacterium]|nr:hypothetical protein [Atopobiaceae bacterium]
MTDREKTLVSNEETNLEDAERIDQEIELDLDDLEGVVGGEKASHYQGGQTPGLIGSQTVYDRMMQLRDHTFRR